MQFHLPIWFDLGATFLFAITGAWIAIRKGYDFVGVFMLALLTGVGGGMLRDVIFIANGPPVAFKDSRFLMAVALGALVGTLTFRRGPQFERLFEIVDALGSACTPSSARRRRSPPACIRSRRSSPA